MIIKHFLSEIFIFRDNMPSNDEKYKLFSFDFAKLRQFFLYKLIFLGDITVI